jgi:hypothetical protein
MDTVCAFIRRLEQALAENAQLSFRHRRLIVPAAAQFALDGTIVRTDPIGTVKRPGGQMEASLLLEWMDLSDEAGRTQAHENDLAVDLAALLALASGRRVAFANEFPMKYEGADWTWFLEIGHMFDGELYGPIEVDVGARLATIIKALIGLEGKDRKQALSLGNTIRMRNAACCLFESDYSSAYGLLVAGIETLSRSFGNPPDSWQDWDQASTWDKLFKKLSLKEEQASALRHRLLKDKQLRLRRTFVHYAAENLSESFWSGRNVHFTPGYQLDASGVRPLPGAWRDAGSVEDIVPKNLAELRKRLGASYDARSSVFHESLRLDQISLLPAPAKSDSPLPFSGLRRVLDHLLWYEIEKGAVAVRELPDIQLFHKKDVNSHDRSSAESRS